METKLTDKQQKLLAKASYMLPEIEASNPWIVDDFDTMEVGEASEYEDAVNACRFFYKRDPTISTVINKLIEIGCNGINLAKNGLSENEFRIFLGIKTKLEEFTEIMAMEYLLSGLVVPEIIYGTVTKPDLTRMGIKKYSALELPVNLYVRDPSTVKIKAGLFPDKPRFFAKIPEELIYFIKSGGKYEDGTVDIDYYNQLVDQFGDFVSKIKDGTREVPLQNNLIIRRKYQPDSPYPIPYVYSSIEGLKHKRNLRRMDYSLASRAIGAIQLFKLGSDDFPVVDGDEDQFDWIKMQMYYRGTKGLADQERIFQLYANHTLDISWVYPPLEALLDDTKYNQVNKDILFGLGFPQLLITGETERSGTSNPEFATLSPEATMENFRNKIINVIRTIMIEIAERNNLKTEPKVDFNKLNLIDYKTFLEALRDLYSTGNLSRREYAKSLGYDWDDQMDSKETENKLLEEKELEDYAPRPFAANQNESDTGNEIINNGTKPKTKVETTKNGTEK